MSTVPHFTLLFSLKLLVCTQKKGFVSKERNTPKWESGSVGNDPYKATAVQGREDSLQPCEPLNRVALHLVPA